MVWMSLGAISWDKPNWLVVWLPFFIFPYIGNNHPNWLSYFSEGWPNHQPANVYLNDPRCGVITFAQIGYDDMDQYGHRRWNATCIPVAGSSVQCMIMDAIPSRSLQWKTTASIENTDIMFHPAILRIYNMYNHKEFKNPVIFHFFELWLPKGFPGRRPGGVDLLPGHQSVHLRRGVLAEIGWPKMG